MSPSGRYARCARSCCLFTLFSLCDYLNRPIETTIYMITSLVRILNIYLPLFYFLHSGWLPAWDPGHGRHLRCVLVGRWFSLVFLLLQRHALRCGHHRYCFVVVVVVVVFLFMVEFVAVELKADEHTVRMSFDWIAMVWICIWNFLMASYMFIQAAQQAPASPPPRLWPTALPPLPLLPPLLLLRHPVKNPKRRNLREQRDHLKNQLLLWRKRTQRWRWIVANKVMRWFLYISRLR